MTYQRFGDKEGKTGRRPISLAVGEIVTLCDGAGERPYLVQRVLTGPEPELFERMREYLARPHSAE